MGAWVERVSFNSKASHRTVETAIVPQGSCGICLWYTTGNLCTITEQNDVLVSGLQICWDPSSMFQQDVLWKSRHQAPSSIRLPSQILVVVILLPVA